ncbi:hypothetical protein [uncultured Sphingomonas sp.]|uniref:hypothetical protein n=1 Tax=uncultured Sphingomonas sp. TaxID=158754 RepID=UPI0035CB93CB
MKIVTAAEELQEGLFGQVLLYIFEILPYLERIGARPAWDIHARFYGGDARPVIPGVLDLAYSPRQNGTVVPLALLRRRHCARLGNDWQALHDLWFSFFTISPDIVERADEVGALGDALGVHYRGTDKLTATWDTNPVSSAEMISFVQDRLGTRPDLRRIFLATDDKAFAGKLREAVDCEVINLGEVEFHKTDNKSVDDLGSARRAMLDCLLLSRCAAVLITSSALSGFTKVFNPGLEIHRCAASKRFTDIPYFPVAYIDPYTPSEPVVAATLERLMVGDWRGARRVRPFRSRARYWRAALKWGVLERIIGSPFR